MARFAILTPRPVRMPPPLPPEDAGPPDDAEAGGPGWYESSRELRAGLDVCDAMLADWQLASSFGGMSPRAGAA